MIAPRELLLDLLQTGLRLLPWPTRTGLRRSGEPGPESPVLVTGNYDLTVRRLLRALDGVDAWVVVAPSAGINVWCAASGGMLTTHQVVTALKTSGVEERVRHRRAVLPQLAATGVEGRDVTRCCGWRVRFGPVRAQDLPRYLASRSKKTDDMRRVRFGARERLEMAAAWGMPASVVLAGVGALLAPAWVPGLVALCAALSLGVFFGFERVPGPRRAIVAATAALVACAAVGAAGGGAAALSTAALASVGLTALLTFDYTGSTPTESGSHFESRGWRIALDEARCVGAYVCIEVCPEACFERGEGRADGLRKVVLSHDERCVRCGACVVQCPEDALAFRDEDGVRIEPDVIRRYKMNLLGARQVDTGSGATRAEDRR